MAEPDAQQLIQLYEAIAHAMNAHATVISAFYENETDLIGFDSDGASNRLLDIDKLNAEMLRLSQQIMPETKGEQHAEAD